MLKHSLAAAAAVVALGAIAIAPAQAWSTATHHKAKQHHHQAATTQSNNEITSFSSSSGVVTGGVGINHPSRK